MSLSDPQIKTRIGFLNTHPIQYFAPLYAYLAKSGDVEPVALYLTDYSLRNAVDPQFARPVTWDVDLLEGYESHFIGPQWREAEPFGFWPLTGNGLGDALKSLQLDALVVFGHSSLAILRAIAIARRLGIRIFYKSDSNILMYKASWSLPIRNSIIRMLFSQIDGFLASGLRNHEYYRWLGVKEERISPFPFAVDNQRLTTAARLTPSERQRIRGELGLRDETPVLTFAAKLTQRKRAADLLAAAAILYDEGLACQVLLIGSGEEENALRAQAQTLGMPPVIFAGFRNQSQLPRLLAAGDIFVQPAENEPYGLTINEAMCAGLPIVATNEIGCVPDLVGEDNGRLYPAGDVAALAGSLQPLIASGELRRSMGQASLQRIGKWSFAEDLAGLRRALAMTPAR